MSQVITSLTNPWVDELSFGIAKKVVLGINWLDWVRVEPGVNGVLKLQNVTTAPLFRAGSCDMTDSGTTTFAGNSLTVCQVGTQESICLETLNSTYLGQYQAKSMLGLDTLPFQEFLMTEKAEQIQKALGKLAWQGSNSSPSYATVTGNNLFCDGFLQTAYEASATTVNVVKSAWTKSNAFGYVDAVYTAAVTADMKGGSPDGELYMFVSPNDFDQYLANRAALNLFHDAAGIISAGGKVDTIRHFGARNLTLVSTNGLDGAASGTFLITYKENIVFGCLAEKDNMALDGIYDPYARVYRTIFRTKIGTQFVFNEHVVASISAYGTAL